MTSSSAAAPRPVVYHEKQLRQLCAVHCLNNLLQRPDAFSKKMCDDICHSLSPDTYINPHKSFFGLGNYDANVIMVALQKHGLEANFFDKRKDPSCLVPSKLFGLILNVPSFTFWNPLSNRHWIAIREVSGQYFNLDSKLKGPAIIGTESDLIEYLRDQLKADEKQLLVVVSKEVSEDKSWLNET